MYRFTLLLLVLVVSLTTANAKDPEIVANRMLWDSGKHNAFTDLVRYENHFYCTFREGDAHVGGNGSIRILKGKDFDSPWESVGLLKEDGIDLRDPKLSITPEGKLLVLMGGSVYEGKTRIGRQPRVAFGDGKTWSKPQRILKEGDWLWRVTWHKGICYGVTYTSASNQEGTARLLKSKDGVTYEEITTLHSKDKPNEATLRFQDDGTMVCLLRKEGGDQKGWVGSARSPYTDWKWNALDYRLGGPEFIILPNGDMWASSRRSDKGGPKTAFGKLSLTKFDPQLTFPSQGDSSYPGMVWYEGQIWMSYYSSHEGKSKIYLARVKIPLN